MSGFRPEQQDFDVTPEAPDTCYGPQAYRDLVGLAEGDGVALGIHGRRAQLSSLVARGEPVLVCVHEHPC